MKLRHKIKLIFFKMMGYQNRHYFDSVKNTKKIFFLNVPTYGNMGDQAIVQSTIFLLKEFFGGYKIIVVKLGDIFKQIESIKKACTSDDVVILPGGGNVGNWYEDEEAARQLVIKNIKNCKIISMPQSIFFSKDFKGQKALRKAQRNYSKNKNFTLITREKYSYEYAENNFNCHSILTPDIVFYLATMMPIENVKREEKITVCLRADKESDLENNSRAELISGLENVFGSKMFLFDTTLNRNIDDETRKLEVKSILREFSRAQLVVTDRLHGMVFSAITQTPCIVLRSSDTKIIGTYEWVKNLNYVRFLDNPDLDTIISTSEELMNLNRLDSFTDKFDFSNYDPLKTEFQKAKNNK